MQSSICCGGWLRVLNLTAKLIEYGASSHFCNWWWYSNVPYYFSQIFKPRHCGPVAAESWAFSEGTGVGVFNMGRPKLYMESIWNRLPAEILESKILRFLPIASLCRFKTVSKKWNMLISHPDCALAHARASSSIFVGEMSVELLRSSRTSFMWPISTNCEEL